MKKIIIQIVFFLSSITCLTTALSGQNTSSLGVTLETKQVGDSIVIRWIPDNYDSWVHINQNGVKLERHTLIENGDTLSYADYDSSLVLLLTTEALDTTVLDSIADENDFTGAAIAATYGDSFRVGDFDTTDWVTISAHSDQVTNRYNLGLYALDQDFSTAKKLNMGFVDHNTADSTVYLYSVSLLNVDSSKTSKNGYSRITKKGDYTSPLPCDKPYAEIGHKVVHLEWITNTNHRPYSTFNIYRSSDNGASYTKLNDLPLIPGDVGHLGITTCFYEDSLDNENISYIYYVEGISPFGFKSPPSDTIHVVSAPKELHISIKIDSVVNNNNTMMRIYFSRVVGDTDQITGFNVYRSSTFLGHYTKINSQPLSPDATSFEDLSPSETNYYKIAAIDSTSKLYFSPKRVKEKIDTIPPDIVEWLPENVSPDGLVSLTWKSSNAKDLRGYKVLYATSVDGPYAQLNSRIRKDTVFFHKLHLYTLSEFVYYKIVAVDTRYNNSEWSKALQVKRPDIIPPTKPYLRSVVPGIGGIHVLWELSSSSDAELHLLQRKRKNTGSWETVLVIDSSYHDTKGFFSLGNSTNQPWVDSTVSVKYTYTYRLRAFDEANNSSTSDYKSARPFDNGIRGIVQNLTSGFYSQDGQGNSPQPGSVASPSNSFPDGIVRLSWNYTGNKSDILHWEIYRKSGARPFKLYTVITQEEMDLMIANGIQPAPGRQYVFADLKLLPYAQLRDQLNGANSGLNGGGGASSGGTSGGGSSTTGGGTPSAGGELGDLYSYQVRAIHEDGGRSLISFISRIQL